MKLAQVHRDRYGNRFTLTLLDYRDERRRSLRIAAWTSLLASSVAVVTNRFINRQVYETL